MRTQSLCVSRAVKFTPVSQRLLRNTDGSRAYGADIDYDAVMHSDDASIMVAFRSAALLPSDGGLASVHALDDCGIPVHKLLKITKLVAELRRCNNDYRQTPRDLTEAMTNLTAFIRYVEGIIISSDSDVVLSAARVRYPTPAIMRAGDEHAIAGALRTDLGGVREGLLRVHQECDDYLKELSERPPARIGPAVKAALQQVGRADADAASVSGSSSDDDEGDGDDAEGDVDAEIGEEEDAEDDGDV